jgi:hypothetical protein
MRNKYPALFRKNTGTFRQKEDRRRRTMPSLGSIDASHRRLMSSMWLIAA